MEEENKGGQRSAILLWGMAILLVVAIVIMAVKFRNKPAEKTEVPVEKSVLVRTLEVQAQTVTDSVTLPGRTAPFADVTVAMEKPGRVTEVSFQLGDRVAQGAPLLAVDSGLWQTLAERSEVDAADAKRELQRWEAMRATGAVSDSDFDRVVNREHLARVALEEARLHLRRCKVASPVDGVVEEKYLEPGEYATEGAPVCRIVVVDRLKVRLDVPEREVMRVAMGAAVSFRVLGIPEREFVGRVIFLSAAADAASNCFPAELEVDNRDGALKAGMIVEATLVRGQKENALVIPFAAVLPWKGEHVVFVVQANRAVRRTVRIESLRGDSVVISAGVAAGDRVVTEGNRALQDGMMVEETSGSQTP